VRGPTSLTQPLISRPAYGEGLASSVAESKLPKGEPGGKGLSLDKDLPGSSTYNKPENDVRDFDRGEDETIYRRDNADDLLKKRDRVDTREENADKHDSIGYMGKGEWEGTVKTKYPYRDGLPNAHNASASFVVERWRVAYAPERRLPAETKVAATLDEILSGLNPKFQARAQTCSVSVRRADIKNLRWIFSVDCGNGPKVVKVKGYRHKGAVKLTKMDLDLACSCPAWRWLGPEHHAKREDYLDKEPRGTASVPVIRDPEGINRVCKHVAAVMSHIKAWTVGKK